ncbi:hypothetical protein EVAR_44375_1 [Eumeta japonica]|uniref:Uncharacterized protein n=1 Tax=Eumeta variegata TaxID=151549 RepID=A0A4C1XA45_EUMVA|nr:hypothetical protein EVAR_44375_1 [Eumeta japonica]
MFNVGNERSNFTVASYQIATVKSKRGEQSSIAQLQGSFRFPGVRNPNKAGRPAPTASTARRKNKPLAVIHATLSICVRTKRFLTARKSILLGNSQSSDDAELLSTVKLNPNRRSAAAGARACGTRAGIEWNILSFLTKCLQHLDDQVILEAVVVSVESKGNQNDSVNEEVHPVNESPMLMKPTPGRSWDGTRASRERLVVHGLLLEPVALRNRRDATSLNCDTRL